MLGGARAIDRERLQRDANVIVHARPVFLQAWHRFLEINVPVVEVGKKIGGKVQYNIEKRIFPNACPIRMSYVLNYSHVPIPPPSSGYAVVSGADKKWYMYRVPDMMKFLEQTFGTPDRKAKNPKPSDFSGIKGILVVKGHGWRDAVGHVTLWNGSICSDSCHLASDPDNGSFAPETASLWELA